MSEECHIRDKESQGEDHEVGSLCKGSKIPEDSEIPEGNYSATSDSDSSYTKDPIYIVPCW